MTSLYKGCKRCVGRCGTKAAALVRSKERRCIIAAFSVSEVALVAMNAAPRRAVRNRSTRGARSNATNVCLALATRVLRALYCRLCVDENNNLACRDTLGNFRSVASLLLPVRGRNMPLESQIYRGNLRRSQTSRRRRHGVEARGPLAPARRRERDRRLRRGALHVRREGER